MSVRGEFGDDEQRPATVFGAPDQAEMVARLDAVADDDLDSDFFDAAVIEAQDAGGRVFDVGIRTLANEVDGGGRGSSSSPAGSPFVEMGSAGRGASDPDLRAPSVLLPEHLTDESDGAGSIDFSDPDVRAAFILGGPAAILRRG